MELKKISLSKITPYEKNARKNDEAVEYVIKSIQQCEYIAPIILDENNVILAGHTRYKALKKLGYKEADCVIKEGLTEEQKKKYRLLDNKTAEFAEWDFNLLEDELTDLDFGDLDIDWVIPTDETADDFESNGGYYGDEYEDDDYDLLPVNCQHNVFENQEVRQFPIENYYGIPTLEPTQTIGDKFLRFMDWKICENPEEYIAHFFYDDYAFISAWRSPNKYVERLRRFKAVVAPDFSSYTDFPIVLQILGAYRRNWCGAYWQSLGIDVIPDVQWGNEETYKWCFEGIPKNSTVAISSLGVANNKDWNGDKGDKFRQGFEEMKNRLQPTTILWYGNLIDGCEGNIIHIPYYYDTKQKKIIM